MSYSSSELYLASQSPRRAELLRQLDLSFETLPIDIDESPLGDELPVDYVRRMAIEKASAGCSLLRESPTAESDLERSSDEGLRRLVLAADTVVVHENHILGKPADAEQARAMMAQLSADRHWVMTAVALACIPVSSVPTIDSVLSKTQVHFRAVSDAEAR